MGQHLDDPRGQHRHSYRSVSAYHAASHHAVSRPAAIGVRMVGVLVLVACALVVAPAKPYAAADLGASDPAVRVGPEPAQVEPAFRPIMSLVVRDQPTTATLNTPLDPPVVVAVVDGSGRPVLDTAVGDVEVALRPPPGVLSPLGGSTSAPVVDGVAVLDDLRLRTTGEGYRLDVEVEVDGTWLEVTSDPFAVVVAEPPRAGHVDAVDCAQAAPGAGLLFLDGRPVEAVLATIDDGRGVRLEHPDIEGSLSVPATLGHPAGAVSGRTLLLGARDAVSVRAGRLLPSSPVGVWLLGDPPCPLAASGADGPESTTLRHLARFSDGPESTTSRHLPRFSDGSADAVADDAAMVEVTPLGTLTAAADGTVRGSLGLPAGLTPGASTVQVVATLADGRSMLAATGVLLTPPPFADVDPAGVHAPAIRRITTLGITRGLADATYGPGASVTRGQMASFLARALELDTGDQPRFPDALGTVHAGAVAAVAEAGIASGYADGTFGVGEPIRRDQMASMLAAAAGLGPQAEGPFADLGANVHAPAVNAVAAAGIALGDGHGRYRPADPVRRDQMASFLVRLLDHERDGSGEVNRAR